MSEFKITDSTGKTLRAVAKSVEYNGTFLGESYVTCTVDTAEEINWQIGDKVKVGNDEYVLNTLPTLTRNARSGSYGNAIEYRDVKFDSLAYELRNCRFLDFVLSDNKLHFTALPNVSFVCERVEEFAYRLQVNLDRLYGQGKWLVGVYSATQSEGSLKNGKLTIHTDGNDPITYINTVYANGYETIATDGGADNKMQFSNGALLLSYTESNGYFIKTRTLSFSNVSCWDALAQFSNETGVNFMVRGRKVILGYRWEGEVTDLEYGKGNGLVSLERNAVSDQQIVTRLRAYGNTRNLAYRYYNYVWAHGSGDSMEFMHKRIDSDKESWRCIDIDADGKIVAGYDNGTAAVTSGCTRWYRIVNSGMYVPNLMLPDFRKNSYAINKAAIDEGTEPVFTDFDAWIDSNNKTLLGIKEGCVFFDGSDSNLEDIYPSLTGMLNQNLYDALTAAERAAQNIKPDNTDGWHSGAIDRISDCTATTGDGWSGIIPEDTKTSPTFTIYIPNPAFNPGDTELKSDDTPKVNMLDGACAGREFEINGVQRVHKNASGAWEIVGEGEYNNPTNGWWYALTCNAISDDSIGQYFPNANYQIKANDQFVLTGIMMPDVYVRVAEQRLESVANTWLSENDHTQYNYAPKVNNIYMAQNPDKAEALREGSKVRVYDKGLGIDEDITISAVRIKYGGQIPEYEITLSDNQEATLAQKVASEVNQKFSQYFYYGGGGGSVTANSVLNKYLKVMTDINGKVYLLSTVDFASERDITAYMVVNPAQDEEKPAETDTNGFYDDTTLDADGNTKAQDDFTTTRNLAVTGGHNISWCSGNDGIFVGYFSDGTMAVYKPTDGDGEQLVTLYDTVTYVRMAMATDNVDNCYIKDNTDNKYIWKGKNVK